MRDALASAEVGDDVFGEDPCVARLEQHVASLLGKAAAMFFPSGTMANQACLRLHTRPGDVVIAARDCHILRYEAGAASGLSGLQIKTIGRAGSFDADEVAASLHPDEQHHAPTTLLAIENTHNAAGGTIFPQERMASIEAVAREAGMAVHLDGARLWNASVASGRSLAELAAPFDSVSVCLSKGLGAPVGSVVVCGEESVTRLRRIRKMLGGGMRQAGFLAAAGQYAVEHHVDRLAEDHANARALAEGLTALGYAVAPAPETNLVMFEVSDDRAFLRASRERGVWINPTGPGRFRAVTHLDVSAADVSEALERLADLPA